MDTLGSLGLSTDYTDFGNGIDQVPVFAMPIPQSTTVPAQVNPTQIPVSVFSDDSSGWIIGTALIGLVGYIFFIHKN